MGTYLSRTPSSEGNRKTFTFSTWVKRSKMSGQQTILLGYNGNNNLGYNALVFKTNNQLALGGWSFDWLVSTAIFRDPSAWYHIVLAVNTPDSTANDRIKLYVNGTQLTDFGTRNNPSQNDDFAINDDVEHNIGSRSAYNSSDYLDGYLAECYMIDGQALAPTSFGQTDSTTGIWTPKTYSGSYGTNGFRLEFKNAGALGTDTSGNTNTWTVNNAGTGAQVVDTPSNVFATLNPVAGAYNNNTTIVKGALQSTTGGDNSQYFASMGVTKGKWCWEVKLNGGDMAIGLFNKIPSVAIGMGGNDYSVMAQLYYTAGGSSGAVNRYQYNSTNYYNIPVGFGNDDSGTIYQFLLDLDSGTKTWIVRRAGDASTQGSFTLPSGFLNGDFIIPGYSVTSSWPATEQQWNFGNPPHSIASGNSDANGYGNFEYAVPSGYYALCTENLNTYG